MRQIVPINNKELVISFGPFDRWGALTYALRMSRSDGCPFVIFFDYDKDEWKSTGLDKFLVQRFTYAQDDVRVINPDGSFEHF